VKTVRCACGLLLGIMLLACGGCGVAGAAATILYPPRVEPMYVPVKTAPMLVLVENRQNPGMVVPEADELSGYITREIERQQIAPVVPLTRLQALRDRDPQAAKKMSISDIGKAVDARQVLYVDLISIQATDVVGMPTTGKVEMLVHVVDPATGKTLWPTNPYPVRYQTTATREFESGEETGLRSKLMQGAAKSVVHLFYEWDPEAEEEQ